MRPTARIAMFSLISPRDNCTPPDLVKALVEKIIKMLYTYKHPQLSDGDGHNELVIGYSDRRVRSYRWLDAGGDSAAGNVQGTLVLLENWQLAGQVKGNFKRMHQNC